MSYLGLLLGGCRHQVHHPAPRKQHMHGPQHICRKPSMYKHISV